MTSELAVYIGLHLVALPTDGGTEVNAQLRSGKATLGQRLEPVLDDARCRSAPAGVKNRRSAGRMRDEDRDTIRDTDDKRDAAINRCMSIGVINAEPTIPARLVHDHARAVNLSSRGKPHTARLQFVAK